jgi:hypothetical protein
MSRRRTKREAQFFSSRKILAKNLRSDHRSLRDGNANQFVAAGRQAMFQRCIEAKRTVY